MVVVELDRMEVSPTEHTVIEGESFTVLATPRDADGHALYGRNILWSTADGQVVALSSGFGGQVSVTGLAPGRTTVRAVAEGRSAVADVTVLVGPSIALSEAEVTIQGRQGEAAAGIDVGIANGGNGVVAGLGTQVTYGAGEPTGWLSVGLNGTTAPTSMTLLASGAALVPGSYSASVRVTSPSMGGLSAQLQVSFEVSPPPPAIALEADAVGLSANFGDATPASAAVGITNGGADVLTGLSATIHYPSGSRTGWLSVGLSDTQAPANLRITAVATGLQAGNYAARVAVRSPVARVSPVFIDVTFRVAQPGAGPGPPEPPGRRP